jgi:hypothetical protein
MISMDTVEMCVGKVAVVAGREKSRNCGVIFCCLHVHVHIHSDRCGAYVLRHAFDWPSYRLGISFHSSRGSQTDFPTVLRLDPLFNTKHRFRVMASTLNIPWVEALISDGLYAATSTSSLSPTQPISQAGPLPEGIDDAQVSLVTVGPKNRSADSSFKTSTILLALVPHYQQLEGAAKEIKDILGDELAGILLNIREWHRAASSSMRLSCFGFR